MDKRLTFFMIFFVFLHILCFFYLLCKTLFFYDHPVLMFLLPIVHIMIYLIILKKKKAKKSILILTALSITIIVFVSQTNMKAINILQFGENNDNTGCVSIKDLKNNVYDSAGVARFYRKIMLSECYDYIEKERASDNEDACMLHYDYNRFFLESNAECLYKQMYEKYTIEEHNCIDNGKMKAFVIDLDSEISYIKEFCIKNECETVHGFFWGDIDKEDLLRKIEELY